MEHINRMSNATLLDSSVNIENNTPTIEYNLGNLNSLQKNINKNGYGGSGLPFVDELTTVAELESMLQHGNEYKHFLYTFRSCARALPQVTKNNETSKLKIYQATWKVLRPIMKKIKDVMDFQHVVVTKFTSEITRLSNTLGSYISGSDMLFEQLIKMIDLITILDHLKDNKTSIKDDFNCYKRCFHSVQNDLEDEEDSNSSMIQQEIEKMQLFLSDPRHPRRYIYHSLKNKLTKKIEIRMMLIKLIEYCCNAIELDKGITPHEKCRPRRVLPVLMNILDGLGTSTSRLGEHKTNKTNGEENQNQQEEEEEINIFKHKNIDANKLAKILKTRPVVPLYMDMHIKMIVLLKDCPNFNFEKGSTLRKLFHSEETEMDSEVIFNSRYSLENEERWSEYRSKHSKYMIDLQRAYNNVSNIKSELHQQNSPTSSNPDHNLTYHDYSKYTNLLLNGLHLLNELSSSVIYQSAWKYSHSASRHTAIDKDTNEKVILIEGIDYALATVHNYTNSEYRVLIDIISMIKSLSSLLTKVQVLFNTIIRIHISHTIQIFVQHTVLGLLYKAHKHKRTAETTHLLQLRALLADWYDDIEPFEDYKSKTKVYEIRKIYENVTVSSNDMSGKFEVGDIGTSEDVDRINAEIKANAIAPIPIRTVAPTSTQLLLMRSMVKALYDDRAPWSKKGGLFSSGTFTKYDLINMKSFYTKSESFEALLNMNSIVQESSDISSLWYRELYLEMTKQVQFPISMSLPWKLAEHVIKSPSNNMLENMLYAIDIYNDAANVALNVLQVQHVYDEIEAEVNLVFDQLMYLLSHEVYTYSKNVASMVILDGTDFTKTMKEINKKENKKGKIDKSISGKLLLQYQDIQNERYASVVNQRHVQLLGRSIDIRALMIERLNMYIKNDIEQVLLKFEKNDLTFICQVEMSLNILKETYIYITTNILKTTGNTETLDHFDMVLEECNEMTNNSTTTNNNDTIGRIGTHIFICLIHDIYPNWIYNEITRRFLKPNSGSLRKSFFEQMKTERNHGGKTNDTILDKKYSKIYEAKFKLYKNYFGREHCESIISILENTSDLYIIIDSLLNYQKILVLEEVAPYVAQLQIGLRPIKLPPYQLRAGGSYLAIQLALKPIMDYDDIKSEVFQNFRLTGNALAFFHLMDATMTQSNCFEFIATASFLGVSPDTLERGSGNVGRGSTGNKDDLTSTPAVVPFLEIMKTIQDDTIYKMAEHAVNEYNVTNETGCIDYCEKTRDPLLTIALSQMKRAVFECMNDTRKGGHLEFGSNSAGNNHLNGIEEEEEEDEDQFNENETKSKAREEGEEGEDLRPYLWDDSVIPTNGVVDVETTKAFHRIFSAMQFMYCEPSYRTEEVEGNVAAPPPIDDRQEFGDGLAWCGIALIHVLNQKARYNMTDFASHVLNVSEWEGMHNTNSVGNVDQETLSTLSQFLGNAKEFKLQSERLFNLFESHLKIKNEGIVVFHPPGPEEMKK